MYTIFITGGTGCIGSVTIYKLLASENVGKIVVATRSNNTAPLKLWLGESLDPRLEFITLDVADLEAINRVLPSVNPTHIIHLGAYQSPDCSNFHNEGMQINVGGTMALFDMAEKLPGLQRFVFASSAAVYGMRSMYPEPGIKEDAPLAPPNHYGIWKLAGEQLARLYYDQTSVPTICLRINTTYGKGRDKGKTSAPTNALKAIALGEARKEKIPFMMPYQGRENYHFVEDVGAQFAACALQPFEGFGILNIKGKTISIEEYLQIAIDQAAQLGMAPFAYLSVAPGAPPNLFVSDLSHEKIGRTFKDLPLTEIEDGVRKSLIEFREMSKNNVLQFSTAKS